MKIHRLTMLPGLVVAFAVGSASTVTSAADAADAGGRGPRESRHGAANGGESQAEGPGGEVR